MTLDERLQNVAVLGAGGKMGSGISLLLAREMTLQRLRTNQPHQLILMDVAPAALEGLKGYLRQQSRRYALKNSPALQELYGPVPDEEALADQFAEDVLATVKTCTKLEDVAPARMVFEAILEKLDLKISVYSQLREFCSGETFFFTNTSSIPIEQLDKKAGLNGRLIGFHFYNPPAVQKLVELITPASVHPELPKIARELGRRLGKKLIPSNDVAGFIGNGHFMRDGLFGLSLAERVSAELSPVQAVYAVNRVSQDYLIRPMGIFQLIDYVGIDVFQLILKIMAPHFPDEQLHSRWIDEMMERGIKGGQHPDGSQKDGFLKYENGQIAAVFDRSAGRYVSLNEANWKAQADDWLGSPPPGQISWKAMLKDPEKEARLRSYFKELADNQTNGAKLAVEYLKRSREIGEQLLSSGVANSAEDVNGVLMYGFYHLYGPIHDYL